MQVKLQTDLAFVSRRPRFVGGRVAGAQRRGRGVSVGRAIALRNVLKNFGKALF